MPTSRGFLASARSWSLIKNPLSSTSLPPRSYRLCGGRARNRRRPHRRREGELDWDILIRGGLVIDGSGRPGTVADVAVRGGRIAAIGSGLVGEARRVIAAEGLVVSPGFIDIKTHSDFTLPINPKAESKVRQGVTTEII